MMRSSNILIAFLILYFFTKDGTGFKRPAGSKCQEFFPVDVNETWFFKFAKEGMDNPMGTKYSLQQGFNAPPLPKDDTSLNNTMCMTAEYKIFIQTFSLTVVFRYNRINEFKAYVQTEGTPAKDAFKLYGDFVMGKTDNSSYILFFGCLFEAQEFWQVHSPAGTNLTLEAKKEILKEVKAKKFRTGKEDISSSSDSIWLERATISDCNGKSGIGGLFGNLPKMSKGGKSKPDDDEGSKDSKGILEFITGLLNLG